MKKITITPMDVVQIMLNIVAFLVLMFATGGHGSFWGFLTFNIIAGITLIEILSSKDKTAVWVWITKTFTYIMLVIKFSSNMGTIKPAYIVMIAISAAAFIISKRLIKKRAVSMWGQVAAYLIGGYMYIMAIVHSSGDFGAGHMWFWGINCLSYILLVCDIVAKDKPRVNLIIPLYALFFSLVYAALMVIF